MRRVQAPSAEEAHTADARQDEQPHGEEYEKLIATRGRLHG